ncbi:hypothetical protein FUSO3_01570 [Fusobacterium necrophorum BL]|uniref:Uncharacterized protein n=2 Tax=Fusobacterium necrophorum TaxID=859 RepID=A0A0B4FRU1_9FUSO|nr:hypothetical protein FUSO3_01570 [Fusobacterium necrophorum BL]KID50202.1 hypothetical protein C095_00745 [Fusobacterium necrophorum subsp. funduliforme B35]
MKYVAKKQHFAYFFYAKKQHNKRMFLKNNKNMRDRKFGI